MTEKDILCRLTTELSILDESDLIAKPDYSKIEDICCEYLKTKGYKVVKLIKHYNIKHINDLVNIFYNLMEHTYPDKYASALNMSRDPVMFGRFVSSRQEHLGCTYENALEDCGDIIRCLFKYKDRLGLNTDIGIWVLGTGKCRWVTDKVIQIMNNESNNQNDITMQALTDKFGVEEDESITNYFNEGDGDGC